MDPYLYQSIDIQRVVKYKSTEPALSSIFEAKRSRESREAVFNSEYKINLSKEEYLESIKNELTHRSRAFKFQIFEIGKLIFEAKKNLPHGEFQSWVEENFDHGYRTAHNCMKVFVACMGNPEVVEYFNPSCLYLIASKKFSDDLRTALFDRVKGPVDVKRKDLVLLSMRIKNNEITIDDKEVQDLLIEKHSLTVYERCEIELESMRKRIDQSLNTIRSLLNTHSTNPIIDDDNLNALMENKQEVVIKGFVAIKSQIASMINELKSENIHK